MGRRIVRTVLLTGALSVALGSAATQTAWASDAKPPLGAVGVGTLGSPWKMRVALNVGNGQMDVGEAFAIDTSANTPPDGVGQPWAITFAQNGHIFFNDTQITATTGVSDLKTTPRMAGPLHMTVHAVNQVTGETIDGGVAVP